MREKLAWVLSYRYLQEVGYTDTILDVKSKQVRALLGLSSDASEKENRNQEPMVNGTEGQIKENTMIGWVSWKCSLSA